ncbi:phosphomannomutase/phosphoglucomutase [Luteimonas cucumeris]|uniref:phosphomannomutase n=1 Tax=Luteimonas cucumeris TaxID=985012 RepID=A0A562LDT8_9GAMM|nr:phosphomannomutase/phosphoglucomutase [Luteimonas cucumeris]TWI05842.1 phosphomannomutase/phosphoglucomutase [Luteimonas cucumeris]
MTDSEARRFKLDGAATRPALPWLMAALAVLALWLGWSGVQQMRDGASLQSLTAQRDAAAAEVAEIVGRETRHLSDKLGQTAIQTALQANDLDTAAARIGAGWNGVQRVEVLPPDLHVAYDNLPKTGYGRLAAAEAALGKQAAVARVAADKGAPRLVVAAPAKVGARTVGVVLVQFPLTTLTAGLAEAGVDDDNYLALRQGSYTVLARGDDALGNSAEALAAKVPNSDFRIAAAVPDTVAGPWGLAAVPCLVLALVLASLALTLWLVWRRTDPARAPTVDAEEQPTLAQALETTPVDPDRKVIEVKEAPKRAPVMIDRGIFRAYDIRGVVGETLDIGVAELIGHAIGSAMHDQGLEDIAVGRDGRLSGPDMVGGLIAGLRRAGRNVIDVGLAPTPLIYFAAYHLRTGSAVAVTGSHNPPDYNGFKIVIGGETLSGDAITDLYARIADGRLHEAATPGTLNQRDVSDDYVSRVASDVQIDRRLKVVVDAGNGAAGELGPRVLEAIGADVVPLYCEIDGTFPNHHPDPSEPHNLEDLRRMVERLDADLGIAFDGDGDRLGVITRDGHNIFPDRLLMLFAADVLERNPGAVIVYDVKCTGALSSYILRHGGSPLMWKTGHSLIKAKMRETEAELAGEMSGHFFFKERWFGFDDGIYSAARLLEILGRREETPDQVFATIPEGLSTPELKVPVADPHAFVERFVAAGEFEGARVSTIDGLRADWPDGWGLVRASNTTPILVLRFEANDAQTLQRIQNAFRERLLGLDAGLALPF